MCPLSKGNALKYNLVCTNCGHRYGPSHKSQVCTACGSFLEVVYKSAPKVLSQMRGSFWDFSGVLPDGKYRRYEVGMTKMFTDAEDKKLLYKLETENPTHSFKDRGSIIEVAKAKEYGFDEVACASTGNMAYSVAYYSKLYGIKSRIFVSREANRDKIEEIRSTHDAVITRGKWDFTGAQKEALKYSAKTGAFITGDYCYRKEGQKTIAYEIISSAKDVSNIIVPVGNATLLSGTLKALNEMEAAGSIKRQPKVIAVQSERCNPFSKSFNLNGKVSYIAPATSADAIAVGYPTFGDMAAEQLRLNGGTAVSVSEASMAKAQRRMNEDYGITIELASAATIAAYDLLKPHLRGKSVAIISGGNV